MQRARIAILLGSVLSLMTVSACAGHDALAPNVPGAASESRVQSSLGKLPMRSTSGGKIQHVVYIIQENRSFNNLFMGFKGATTQNYGYDTAGTKIPLHSQSISTVWDISHGLSAFLNAYDYGKMDGWNNEGACCKSIPNNAPYAYAPKAQTAPYWSMAEQYALSDMTFQSNLDGSFVAHQYAIAAQSEGETDYPAGYWSCYGNDQDTVPTITQGRTFGPGIPVCQDPTTLGDELDKAGLTWKYYTSALENPDGLFNAYAAVNHIFNGPDFTNDIVNPQSQFISDVAAGKLAAVTWITPTYANSDHGGVKSKGGPAWVASLVNAVGSSQFWDSTAIFVIWDDWGGWFDPVTPVYKDYDGLGFRVPLIMISPYAKAGYVTHVQYESSSVLRFMEDNFGLKPLSASDTRAADPAGDAFDFNQKPIVFKQIQGSKKHLDDDAEVQRPPVDGD